MCPKMVNENVAGDRKLINVFLWFLYEIQFSINVCILFQLFFPLVIFPQLLHFHLVASLWCFCKNLLLSLKHGFTLSCMNQNNSRPWEIYIYSSLPLHNVHITLENTNKVTNLRINVQLTISQRYKWQSQLTIHITSQK